MKKNPPTLFDKSKLLVAIASMEDDDPRLPAVENALIGTKPETERPNLRLYKMGAAARETGLSRSTLWRAIRDGRLRSVEIRKDSHRIPEAELLRLVLGR